MDDSRLPVPEMLPRVLVRALDPFPVRVRTLDAIHLASAGFLRQQGQPVEVATYGDRMGRPAVKMGFELIPL
jgi:hypothetical protein